MNRRGGFTLIELLMVIIGSVAKVIAVFASLTLWELRPPLHG